ncbi:MAG: hypothetical protein Q9193_003702 [Seirophora villosa]
MASKPSCKDYGIPGSLAVPPGELISGWSDNIAHYTSRTILYNLHVIYDMQREIIRRLDRQSTPAASDTDVLERPNGSDEVRPDIVSTQYLDAAAAATPPVHTSSSHPPGELPPFIRRFASKPNEATTTSAAGNDVPASLMARELVTGTMAPSDSITSDLAGLLIDCSPSNTETSPPSPPAAEDDDTEELVSLPKPDDRLWARLHELAGNEDDDDASVSSSNTARQDHLDLVYGAGDADGSTFDRFTVDIPASQSHLRSPSSCFLRGDNDGLSTSTQVSSATKSPHEIPLVQEHPSLATASSQRSNPQIQFGTIDRKIFTPSQAIIPAQQRPLVPVDVPAATQSTPKRTIITTTTTTTTPPNYPLPKNEQLRWQVTTPNHTFEQWRSQAERQSIKPSDKEKQKVGEFSFW